MGAEALLERGAGRLGRQDGAERRIEQALLGIELRADRDHQRAAAAHVARDVLQIHRGQNVAPAIAVEDDEVEFVESYLEQLADRKGDQRQLGDGREVLRLRRAEDREVDEVDRRIGLEQRAPGALAGMRLAGHQQDAQPVAHAVHRHDGAVVLEREFARPRLGDQLEQALPAALEREVERVRAADRHRKDLRIAAVALHRHPRLARRRLGAVVDAHDDLDRPPDDGEARRAFDDQPPVALVAIAGDQRMDRPARRLGRGGNVVHLAVGDQKGGGEARTRHIGECAIERFIEPRAVARCAGRAHDPQFEIAHGAHTVADLLDRGLGTRAPLADRLAWRFVDDHHRDVVQHLALFLDRVGIGEAKHQARGTERAPHGAARAPPPQDEQQKTDERPQHRERRPRQQRLEDDRKFGGVHRRSRSMIASMWTWSAL